MLVRRGSTHDAIDLSSLPVIGEGGQARIFAVSEELAAKIYHRPTELHARKLVAMLASPPADPMVPSGHTSIVWPVDLLSLDRLPEHVAGFVMPRVSGMLRVFEFYNPRSRRQHCPFFDYAYLHRAARNLAAAVSAVHAAGYVIGDLNESNVLLRDTALVTLVDTDSFQVRDAVTGELYRCPVGKPEYTPPELQGKSFGTVDRAPEHDRFSLAVLVFQLLMEGAHPFAGEFKGYGEAPPLEKRIAGGQFPYGRARAGVHRPPRHGVAFDTLHPALRELFLRCFDDGHRDASARPDALTWQHALGDAEHALTSCATNAQHRFGGHLADCPWCARATKLGGRDPFPSRSTAAGTGALGADAADPAVRHPAGTATASIGVATPTPTRPATPRPQQRPFVRPAYGTPSRQPTAAGGVRSPALRAAHFPLAAAVGLSSLTFALGTTAWASLVGCAALLFAGIGHRYVGAIAGGATATSRFLLGAVALLLAGKTTTAWNVRQSARAEAERERQRAAVGGRPAFGQTTLLPVNTRHGLALPLTTVSAGGDHACGLDAKGKLYCWGKNRFARLGTQATGEEQHLLPVAVPTVASIGFSTVGVGDGHACAIAGPASQFPHNGIVQGQIHCWGANAFGQVAGSPYASDRLTASAPHRDPVAIRMWGSAVVTGGAHTCALNGSRVSCMGWNQYGQLGNGSFSDTPTGPVDVAGTLAFASLTAGARHTCGLTREGAAYCWGSSATAQLGTATHAPMVCRGERYLVFACSNVPVAVGGDIRFASLDAGANHTCGVSLDGRLYCWGLDDFGQVGVGAAARECPGPDLEPAYCVAAPAPVGSERRWSSVSAGATHTCALTTDGEAYCWGSNHQGELGDARASDRCLSKPCSMVPARVATAARFTAITAGDRFTCGVTADGSGVLCWGYNGLGQLGIAFPTGAVHFPGAKRGSVLAETEEPVRRREPWFLPWQVDRTAIVTESVALQYPPSLLDAGLTGVFGAQFVVDTLGRADPRTIVTLRSPHELLSQAAGEAVAKMRFSPALKDGRKVRQMMELTFRSEPPQRSGPQ